MEKFETISHEAIEELRAGSPVDAVVSKWPEHEKELRSILNTVYALRSLPLKAIPEPVMQRKYILAPSKAKLWITWTTFVRISTASMAIILFITGIGGTAYATIKSLPGSTLFGLKKQAEQLQLKLTSDPIAKANLQIDISQKRLADARTVFNSPDKNPTQEVAALTELSEQTQQTINSVKSAATSNNITKSNHPIVQGLADVTNQQQALLTQVHPQQGSPKDLNAAAKTALATNTEAKNFIEVIAASNGTTTLTTLSKLSSTSTTATITGTALNVTQNSLIVNSNIITITTSTKVTTGSAAAKIADNDKVTVTVAKSGDVLVAQTITVSLTGEVKGAFTQSISTESSKISSTTTSTATAAQIALKKVGQENSDAASSTPDPNTATGSFILEDPTPQFVP